MRLPPDLLFRPKRPLVTYLNSEVLEDQHPIGLRLRDEIYRSFGSFAEHMASAM
jgi:hypothetical protein